MVLSNIINIHLFTAKDDESIKLKSHLDEYVTADQNGYCWFLYMFFFLRYPEQY